MAQVIEKHAIEHREKNGLPVEETDRIRDALIAQIFELAANDPNQNLWIDKLN